MPNNQNRMVQQQRNALTQELRQRQAQQQTQNVAQHQTLLEQRSEAPAGMVNVQREGNLSLTDRVRRRMAAYRARKAAQGAPVQQQAAAKDSTKQKIENSIRTRKAKKENSNADYISLSMVKHLDDLHKQQQNDMTDEQMAICGNTIDVRMVRVFCQGFRTDKKGNPATEEDALKKAQDNEFIEAYISRDAQRRKPYLQRMTQEILDAEFTPEMLDISYLKEHVAEVKLMSDRLTYFEAVMKENPDFFENDIPLLQKEILLTKLNVFEAPFSTALVNVCNMKGVDVNFHKFHKNGDGPSIDTLIELKNETMINLREALAAYPAQLNEAIVRVNQQNGANAVV